MIMANSYTTFPDSVQRFDLKTDVSSSVYADWKQFNTYIANGEFANATLLLQSNMELQKCIIDSVYINQISKTVEETVVYKLPKQKNTVSAIGPNRIILGLNRARMLYGSKISSFIGFLPFTIDHKLIVFVPLYCQLRCKNPILRL